MWGDVAGDSDRGRRWRQASLRLVTASGRYASYDAIVRTATQETGLAAELADQLFARWTEITPWPDAPATLAALGARLPISIVTNCSQDLAEKAAAPLGVRFATIVSAERAGWYKPDVRAYQFALTELGVAPAHALFVAGSPHDVTGAAAAGMLVYWHNRQRLPLPAGGQPLANEATLQPLVALLAETA